ncbi:MAG: DUF86 domain-containing protein [Methanofollis sp.]|nr:DUF86 domain-containing protein [Methanofollis sp.]
MLKHRPPPRRARHGVLSRRMLRNLKAMKGFRNIVVHRYGAIDDALTFAILKEHIRDFAQFRQEVESFLRASGCGEKLPD